MSTTRQITRTVRTRSWHDIDPKVAAAAGIAALVTLVLGTLLIAGRITADQFLTTAGAVWGVVSAGYLKRSAETTPGIAVLETTADVLHVVAPVLKDAAPASADVVDQVEDGVELLRDLASRPAVAVATATDPAQSPQA